MTHLDKLDKNQVLCCLCLSQSSEKNIRTILINRPQKIEKVLFMRKGGGSLETIHETESGALQPGMLNQVLDMTWNCPKILHAQKWSIQAYQRDRGGKENKMKQFLLAKIKENPMLAMVVCCLEKNLWP